MFNYEGDTIITGSKDNTCKIWRDAFLYKKWYVYPYLNNVPFMSKIAIKYSRSYFWLHKCCLSCCCFGSSILVFLLSLPTDFSLPRRTVISIRRWTHGNLTLQYSSYLRRNALFSILIQVRIYYSYLLFCGEFTTNFKRKCS